MHILYVFVQYYRTQTILLKYFNTQKFSISGIEQKQLLIYFLLQFA